MHDYKTVFWNKRQHAYCVIIPVYDEGDRVIKLLQRMSDIQLSDHAEIIIVDGGSVDGSTEVHRLKDLQVSGLLETLGTNGLSAQLRCAYDFALKQGYEGIVTIDGNDKDRPEPIIDFISHLANGYDFIQASRFINGGEEANTPVLRAFAIKFVHAPLLSLASGFRWTDTTQGFRGYSRQLLLDNKVAIFRDIFNTYELLAYLSYRAPKLGYKCKELPTSRLYPNGQVPTKITSFWGNLSVFRILILACFGYYNP